MRFHNFLVSLMIKDYNEIIIIIIILFSLVLIYYNNVTTPCPLEYVISTGTLLIGL